jgi:hypothetical protein
MAELKKNVPNLSVYSFKTNDAGAGMCWAGALYPGPNGPDHCASREPGKRMADMVEAFHEGAKQGGGPIDVYIGHSNFWNNEIYSINAHLPENTCFAAMQSFGMSAGSMLGSLYPVRGLINPLAVIRSMGGYENEDKHTIFIDCRASYDRGFETAETISRLVSLIQSCISDPAKGFFPVQDKLRALCADWAGKDGADRLAEAFIHMDEAFKLKGVIAPRFSTMYSGATLRYITRPLVIKPELLSEEDEAYFLPYVFNTRLNEARMDYIDQHGGRIEADPDVRGRLNAAFGKAMQAVRVFEGLADAPEGAWLKSLSNAVRIWISIVRSSGNFYAAQLIRDRNKEILEGEPRVPEKKGTSTGHLDNIPFNAIMRDELDNAAELKKLLADGGLESLCHADDAKYEDTFVLGPDIIQQLEKKIDIMRRHWIDIEDYLEPPHK